MANSKLRTELKNNNTHSRKTGLIDNNQRDPLAPNVLQPVFDRSGNLVASTALRDAPEVEPPIPE